MEWEMCKQVLSEQIGVGRIGLPPGNSSDNRQHELHDCSSVNTWFFTYTISMYVESIKTLLIF